MSLREEMWRYEQITGESAEHVPIIRLGAFLDGYDMATKALEQEPCDDAISRKAILDATVNRNHIWKYITNSKGENLEEIISQLPSVKPQEPKTGHWIAIDEEPHEDYECDNCGYIVSVWTAYIEPHTEYKYCPNCGAKMESEE